MESCNWQDRESRVHASTRPVSAKMVSAPCKPEVDKQKRMDAFIECIILLLQVGGAVTQVQSIHMADLISIY